jgi:hypothetical protein
VSGSQVFIKGNNVSDVRSAFRQAVHHLEAKRGFSPQEAREWILQEARAKKASLEAVAKAVIAGSEVEYHAGQLLRYASPRPLVRSKERLVYARETVRAAVLSENQPLSLVEGRCEQIELMYKEDAIL